jgi:hypothetical protein
LPRIAESNQAAIVGIPRIILEQRLQVGAASRKTNHIGRAEELVVGEHVRFLATPSDCGNDAVTAARRETPWSLFALDGNKRMTGFVLANQMREDRPGPVNVHLKDGGQPPLLAVLGLIADGRSSTHSSRCA